MRVGVDISAVSFNSAGTARYSVEVLKAVQAERPAAVTVIPLTAAAVRVPEPGLARKLFVLYWEWVYCPVVLPARARRLQLDVLHVTAPMPLPARFGRTRVIAALHDILPLTHPEWFPRLMGWRLRRWLRATAAHARHILASSAFTAGELRARLGVPAERLSVVPLGHAAPSAELPAPGVTPPCLLAVGTLEPRKNLAVVLEAYRMLRETQPAAPPLAVVGGRGWGGVTVAALAGRLGIAEAVRELGFVPDARLFALYAGAAALIFPSLAEGFGFPPLEAMAAGCPVVVSNAASLPEVVGEAGLLVDPRDPAAIAAALQRLLTEPGLADRLRALGRARAAEFTWPRCARATLAAYQRLGEGAA